MAELEDLRDIAVSLIFEALSGANIEVDMKLGERFPEATPAELDALETELRRAHVRIEVDFVEDAYEVHELRAAA